MAPNHRLGDHGDFESARPCTGAEAEAIEPIKIDRLDKPHRSNTWGQYGLVWGDRSHKSMATQYPRLFARQKPGGRISGVAKLFLDPKSPRSPVVECILVDYSAGGACLQLEKFVQLPERLEIMYGTTRKRCRVVWKRGLRFGVAF